MMVLRVCSVHARSTCGANRLSPLQIISIVRREKTQSSDETVFDSYPAAPSCIEDLGLNKLR